MYCLWVTENRICFSRNHDMHERINNTLKYTNCSVYIMSRKTKDGFIDLQYSNTNTRSRHNFILYYWYVCFRSLASFSYKHFFITNIYVVYTVNPFNVMHTLNIYYHATYENMSMIAAFIFFQTVTFLCTLKSLITRQEINFFKYKGRQCRSYSIQS